MEWWVEVSDASSGMKIKDWCDYAGHDATADQELSEDMRRDVVRFTESVLAAVASYRERTRSRMADVLRQRKSGHENLAALSECFSSRIAPDPRRSSSYDGAGRARDPD